MNEIAKYCRKPRLTSLASPQPVVGLHILPSPIIPRAKCDNGAKSPLAPTVPCSGTHGRQDAACMYKQQYSISLVFKCYFHWWPHFYLACFWNTHAAAKQEMPQTCTMPIVTVSLLQVVALQCLPIFTWLVNAVCHLWKPCYCPRYCLHVTSLDPSTGTLILHMFSMQQTKFYPM